MVARPVARPGGRTSSALRCRLPIADSSRSVTVTKPIPYTFDLGALLCNDANPLPPSPSQADLASTARDCAQALVNQLLLTCEIKDGGVDGLVLQLPARTTILPREKPLPAQKEKTKWEKFAEKKGIKSTKRKDGKTVYDEATGEWVPKWGYKGKNKAGGEDWIVEVDEKKEAKLKDGQSVRGIGRSERMERIKRNERRQKANERHARKNGVKT